MNKKAFFIAFIITLSYTFVSVAYSESVNYTEGMNCDNVEYPINITFQNLDQVNAFCSPPVCGDGILDIGEECDDGNTEDGDGCSSNCTIEDICENVITNLSNGTTGNIIEFSLGGGSNTDTKITIPMNTTVVKSIFTLKGLPVFFTGEEKVDAVMVNDVSGSMDDNCPGGSADPGETPCKINDIKNATRDFATLMLNHTNTSSRIGLVSYSNDVANFSALTNNIPALAEQINSYAAGGETCISCGIKKAIELHNGSNPTKIITLMSDGGAASVYKCLPTTIPCNTIIARNEAVAQAADAWQNHSIRVYTVAFGLDADFGLMQQIAAAGNGTAYQANETNITDVFFEIATIITEVFPTDPALDIGSNSIIDWSYIGPFNTTDTVNTTTPELNNLISDCSCQGCTLNVINNTCTIDLNISSKTAGKILITGLFLTYRENKELICDDGEDNDCDGLIDLEDPDCQFCGNNNVENEEQCELPDTDNNGFCSQTTQQCLGNQTGVRDNYGSCNNDCFCQEDVFIFSCVEDSCGAQCDSINDTFLVNDTCYFGCDAEDTCSFSRQCSLQTFCSGEDNNTYNFQGACTGQGCEFQQQDCDDLDYFENFTTFCDNNTVKRHRIFHDFSCAPDGCAETTYFVNESFVESCDNTDGLYCSDDSVETRDYFCSAGSCTYNVTDTENCDKDGWYNFGNVQGFDDPTCENRDYFCEDDGLQDFCTFNITETHDFDISDGNYCTQDSEGRDLRDYYCNATGESEFELVNTTDCGTENWAGGGDVDAFGDDPVCVYTDYFCEGDGPNAQCDSNSSLTEDFDFLDTDACFGILSGQIDYWCDLNTCDLQQLDCQAGNTTYTNGCSLFCGAECTTDDQCPDSTCSETFDDFCNGTRLAEYDNDKVIDSTTVNNSVPNTCDTETTCGCSDNPVLCEPPTINEYCVEGVCGATCDENNDCVEHLENDICFFDGTCDTVCACEYDEEFCPEPGTVEDNICYFGSNECTDEGCSLDTCQLGENEFCDPLDGCVSLCKDIGTVTTQFSDSSFSKNHTFPVGGGNDSSATITLKRNLNITGARVNITGRPVSFTSEKEIDAVIVTDVSGSMDDNCPGGSADPGETPCKMNDAKTSDKDLVNVFLANSTKNKVGLTSYASTLINFTGLTNNTAVLYNHIDSYAAGGQTCISCGVKKAIELHNGSNPVKAIILMSDGGAASVYRCLPTTIPCNSFIARNEAVAQAADAWQNHSIRVYTVAFGLDADFGLMQQIAAAGNGTAYQANETNLTDVFLQIASIITLSFPTDPRLDAGTNGINEFSFAGEYSSTTRVHFPDDLNSYLSDCSCYGCTIDGDNCVIDMTTFSSTSGILILDDLNITACEFVNLTQFACNSCSDCGGGLDCQDIGQYSEFSCIYDDVCDETGDCTRDRTVTTYACNNPGTVDSFCSSSQEIQSDNQIQERDTDGNTCGSFRTCPHDQCVNGNLTDYPDSNSDFCASGVCQPYSCDAISSVPDPICEQPPECIDNDGDGYGDNCIPGPDCNDNDDSINPGAVEICDNVDNDCDTVTDEGFDVGDVCSVGIGACQSDGVKICTQDGSGTECNAVAGSPTPEICNLIDDDCDGQTDEGIGGDICDTGEQGVCSAGTTQCVVGVIECQRNIEPSQEICDELDNDCDGDVDENCLECNIDNMEINVSSDKENYIQGEKITITGNAINSTCEPAKNSSVGIQVKNPLNTPVFTGQTNTDNSGFFMTMFNLTPHALLGKYIIHAGPDGNTANDTFYVVEPEELMPVFLDPVDDQLVYGDVILWAMERNYRNDITSSLFEYSADGTNWIGIATDSDGSERESDPVNIPDSGPDPSGFDFPDDVPVEGWNATWDTTGLDEGLYYLRVNMTNGTVNGYDIITVYLDPTPPIPNITLPVFEDVINGTINITVDLIDENIILLNFTIVPADPYYEKGVTRKSQHNYGIGKGTDGSNIGGIYCAPTATASSIDYWADNGYPGIKKHANGTSMTQTELVEELARRMNTTGFTNTTTNRTQGGTRKSGIINGIREYISSHGGGFIVREFRNPTFEDYKRELERNREDVLLWADWYVWNGTGWEKDGAHILTGNAVNNTRNPDNSTHGVGFMDPWTGNYTQKNMTDDGWVRWNTWTWADIWNIISVSPNVTDNGTSIGSITNTSAGTSGFSWDTTEAEDGLYFLDVTTTDATGRTGFDTIIVRINNNADDDNDGIPNNEDLCPDSEGVVDVNGCSCSQKTCDDGNVCTDDTCDETAQCVFTANDTNICGGFRECPFDGCIGSDYYDYPESSNDFCSAGVCMLYECTPVIDEDSELCANAHVVINEFVSDPANGEKEWIELYNPTDAPVDITNWTLRDGNGQLRVLTGVIGAHEFYVVDNLTNKLNNPGDQIVLLDDVTSLIDMVSYGNWLDDNLLDNAPEADDPKSTGRKIDGLDTDVDINDFKVFDCPTKNAHNVIIDCTPPEPPTNLAAELQNGNILLSWDASASSDVAGYNIYFAPTPDGFDFNTPNATTNSTNYTDTSPGDERYYIVRAFDTSGNEGNNINKAAKITYKLVRKSGSTGRNFISIPLENTGVNTASELLSDIGANVVSRFNSSSQSSQSWLFIGIGINFPVRNGEGYEVWVLQNTSWSIAGTVAVPEEKLLEKKENSTGKNWIGLPAGTTIGSASELLSDIPNSEYTRRFDSINQVYEQWNGTGTDFATKTAEGYEVSVSANTSWTPV